MAEVKITVTGEDKSAPAREGLKLTETAIGAVKTAAAALGLSLSAMKLFEFGKDAAMMAARYETLGVTMKVVGNNAGYTGQQMDAYAASLQKTGIAMIESRQNLTQMAQAHIDLAKSAGLARIAQDAAVIGGINSSEAFSRLVYGIQSAQTEVLRTIGINVNFEDSYKKLGKQVGKNAADLTELEKVQARTNAVMEKGKDISGAYEAAMGTAGKQMTSLKRYMDDLKVVVGQTFSDALLIGVQAFTGGLKDANDEAGQLQQKGDLERWGRIVVKTMAVVADAVRYVVITVQSLVFELYAFAQAGVRFHYAIAQALGGNFSGAKETLLQAKTTFMEIQGFLGQKWKAPSFQEQADNFYANKKDGSYKDRALDNPAKQELEENAKLQKERVKLFEATAKRILEIEKQNVDDRIKAEEKALDALKKKYEEKLSIVNNFKDTMKGILAGWADQDKAAADASRGYETPEVRQRRMVAELQSKESDILGSWSMDPSEKVKALNDLDAQYKSLFRAVEDGTDVIISQSEADRSYMDAQKRLRDEINGVAEGMQKEDDALVSLAEQMNRAEGTIAGLNQRISELDRLINALPETKTIDIKLNIQGMNSLAQVAGAMGYQNYGDYYTANGKTYWKDGTLADEGTSFALPRASGGPVTPFGTYLVGERGPELIRMGNQGGSVIPNNQLGGVTIQGPVQFVLPNVTNQSTADDLARNLAPALRRYMGRLG
jgi:hypothetical protein